MYDGCMYKKILYHMLYAHRLYGACNSAVKDFPCAAFNSFYGNYSMCVVYAFLMLDELSFSLSLSSALF